MSERRKGQCGECREVFISRQPVRLFHTGGDLSCSSCVGLMTPDFSLRHKKNLGSANDYWLITPYMALKEPRVLLLFGTATSASPEASSLRGFVQPARLPPARSAAAQRQFPGCRCQKALALLRTSSLPPVALGERYCHAEILCGSHVPGAPRSRRTH